MTIKLYYTLTNEAVRKVEECLHSNNLEYETKNIKKNHLTWDEFLEILTLTEDGASDIIVTRSTKYKELLASGIDLDDLSLTDLYNIILEYPSLIKSPLLVAKSSLLIGYNEEEMSMLKSRSERKLEFDIILNEVRQYDVYDMVQSDIL
ncbi:Spx family transcriptional regulator [Psychrobacillus phage Perkons]|nr:Spx family transcriptional regulator [Psychrobacillus phage Perkons]